MLIRPISRLGVLGAIFATFLTLPWLEAQEPTPRKIIRKISIQGLHKEAEGTILAGLKIHIGEVYDQKKASEETGNLYRTRKFRKVDPPQVAEFEDGVAITYVVEERPVVESIEFKGRKELKESHLKTSPPALETKVGGLYSEAYLQGDEEVIREKYFEAGYIFAQVESKVVETQQGAKVSFIIEEGPRVRIREVLFTGNKSISSSALLNLLNTREKDFWFFGLIRPGFYNYETLEADLITIEKYYKRFGYFDAKAEIEDISLDPHKEKMTIVLRVREGPQYTFKGYRFINNAVFSEQTLRDLTSAIPGQPFDAEVMARDQQEILKYYGDRAYIFADVKENPQFSLEGQDVYVQFNIQEKNEIYVEEVKIQGNVKTQDRVIRRELEFYPGERIDQSRLTKSRSNLNRLQIFKSVSYSYENGSSPSQKNVVVKVEEEPSGRLILGFGVTSGFGIIGNFSIIKRNFDATDLPDSLYDIPESFTGAGQTLNLVAQPGTRRSLYRFTLIEPYIFDTRNALNLSASKLTIIRRDYDEDRKSLLPRISHAFDFDRDFVVSFGERLEEVKISHVDNNAPADAKAAKGFTTVSAVNTAVSYDKVLYEYLEGPYDGTNNILTYEYGSSALGSDVDFHKSEMTNEFYYPIYTMGSGPFSYHHVISLLNRFGIVEPQHSEDSIPIFERFFIGGANTVRGFKFRGLGPHEGGDPTGGTAMLYGNLEYSFPLFQKILRGVVFMDYGNLSPDISSFSFSEMRYAVGGGLRINFPFLGQPLPIGLYLGVPFKKEDNDRTQLFLFTIGTPF